MNNTWHYTSQHRGGFADVRAFQVLSRSGSVTISAVALVSVPLSSLQGIVTNERAAGKLRLCRQGTAEIPVNIFQRLGPSPPPPPPPI